MPATLLPADVVTAAKSVGYTGDANDGLAAKNYLLGHAEPVATLSKDGTDFDLKTWEAPAPEAKKGRALVIPAGKLLGTEPTEDIIARIKADVIADGIKGGWITTSRPGVPGAPVTHVKSGEQREYEDRMKSGRARFSSYEGMLAFKHWMTARFAYPAGRIDLGNASRKRFGELAEGITGKSYGTTDVTGGSALVPDVFRSDLIKNVLDYGAFSRLTKVIQSNDASVILPRRTGGLTTYWPAELATITASNATYDNVQLNAKTVAVLCQAPMQLLQDAHVSVVDEIMDEAARSIAQIKDQCLLIGDSSATYGGMTGFDKKFGTAAGTTGYATTGGDTSDAHTQAQLAVCISRLPAYALPGAVWTCTPTIAAAVFGRLATSTAVGGLLYSDINGRFTGSQFLGFPIVLNNVMNSNINLGSSAYYGGWTAGDVPDILFGDFGRASKLLDLLDVQFDMSSDRGFDSYSMYYRAVARFHSVVHDVGTSTAAGPVVSFWQT